MQFNITFKTIFEYVLKKLVLCIQIRFVSTEKTTRIASRASCYIKQDAREAMRAVFSVLTKRICMHKTKFLTNIFKYCFKNFIKLHELAKHDIKCALHIVSHT